MLDYFLQHLDGFFNDKRTCAHGRIAQMQGGGSLYLYID